MQQRGGEREGKGVGAVQFRWLFGYVDLETTSGPTSAAPFILGILSLPLSAVTDSSRSRHAWTLEARSLGGPDELALSLSIFPPRFPALSLSYVLNPARYFAEVSLPTRHGILARNLDR